MSLLPIPSTNKHSSTEKNAVSTHLRVFLLSEIIPENKSGGEVVLYRHLVESNDFDLSVVKPSHCSLFDSSIWHRIKSTRLYRYCNTIEELLQRTSPSTTVVTQVEIFNPDVILTVAHGRGYYQAVRIAQQLKKPLVTIFHDWWPDMNAVLPGFHWLADWRFHWVAQKSQLCLCVCEQMLNHLGCHEHSVILPPIPGKQVPNVNAIFSSSRNDSFRVGYFGAMYDYGPMLGELAETAMSSRNLKFEFRSTQPQWSPEQIERFTELQVLLPYASREEFEVWTGKLDAILCVMSFAPEMQRRMETSFPSKLIEALQFEKPIILWGPEYCSAVQWARKHEACFCITDSNAANAAKQISRLAGDATEQQHLADNARCLAMTELNPDTIHQQFVELIRTAANRA